MNLKLYQYRSPAKDLEEVETIDNGSTTIPTKGDMLVIPSGTYRVLGKVHLGRPRNPKNDFNPDTVTFVEGVLVEKI